MKLKTFEILIVMAILFDLAFVFGCRKLDEPELCEHAEIVLKADPVVLERKVGAVVEVNYKAYCNLCGEELDWEYQESNIEEITEPNEPIYSPIYNRALSAEEIAEINRKLTEPNEYTWIVGGRKGDFVDGKFIPYKPETYTIAEKE